jgi:uncharacterized delta-60 repeat protein
VARLRPDGRVDASFQSPSPAINQIVADVQPTALALRPDGRLLLGGTRLVQLNTDGTLDSSFSSPLGFGPPLISTLGLDRQGRILFGQVEGSFPQDWRIAASGRGWDPLVLYYLFCVDRCVGRRVTLNSILPMPDGSIYLAGQFTHVGPTFGNFHISASVARLKPDGQEDRTFVTSQFAYRETNSHSFDRVAVRVTRAAAGPDGKLVLAVADRLLRGPHVSSIVRLNPDGKIDRTFACYFRAGDFAAGDQISALAVQTDGRVLVGGRFAKFLGRNRLNLARLNADGSFDDTFDAGAGPNGEVKTIAPTPGGDVLIGGSFTSVNGRPCSGIALLKAEPYPFPPRLLGVRWLGDTIGFSLPVPPGGNYFLEFRDSPVSGAWQVLTNFTGDDAVKSFQDTIGGRASRIYRFRVEP